MEKTAANASACAVVEFAIPACSEKVARRVCGLRYTAALPLPESHRVRNCGSGDLEGGSGYHSGLSRPLSTTRAAPSRGFQVK